MAALDRRGAALDELGTDSQLEGSGQTRERLARVAGQRYPRLPVLTCRGYEPGGDPSATPEPDEPAV